MTPEEAKEKYLHFANNFEEFVRFFLPHYLTSPIPKFHKEIYNLIPSTNRLVLASPRGFAKSTITSVFYPLWLALFQHRKDICIISASETLAVDWLRKIRIELESNQKIRSLWVDLKSSKWTETHLILTTGINIRARGAGGQIRGFRPDCVICDDIETDESVESEEQRKKLKDWLFKACLNTLLPEGQFIIIGTVLHPLSLLADLLAIDNDWTKRKYRAYREGKQEPGYEIWASLWNHEALQNRKREIGSFRFASEYLNDPVADETAPIKEGQIRTWKKLPIQYSGVIAVDPAYSDDETADFKVASLIIIDQAMNRYLVHYIRTHAPIGEFQDAIINLWQSNRNFLTAVGIPHGGGEKAFYDSFLRKCEERKIYPPITELKDVFTDPRTNVSRRSKKGRVVAALQPLFEQGKYYIHADHLEARDELMTIGSSRWDDIVDSMAYAEQILQPVYYDIKQTEVYQQEEEKIIRDNYGLG